MSGGTVEPVAVIDTRFAETVVVDVRPLWHDESIGNISIMLAGEKQTLFAHEAREIAAGLLRAADTVEGKR